MGSLSSKVGKNLKLKLDAFGLKWRSFFLLKLSSVFWSDVAILKITILHWVCSRQKLLKSFLNTWIIFLGILTLIFFLRDCKIYPCGILLISVFFNLYLRVWRHPILICFTFQAVELESHSSLLRTRLLFIDCIHEL